MASTVTLEPAAQPLVQPVEQEAAPAATAQGTLHEWVVYNPRAEWWSHTAKYVLLNVIWVAALVLTVAVTATAFLLASSSTGWTILTTLGAIVFLNGAAGYVLNPLDNLASSAARHAKEASAILAKMEKIEEGDIPGILEKLGIKVADIESEEIRNNLTLLKPLIARYRYAETNWTSAQKVEITEMSDDELAFVNHAIGGWKLYQAAALYLLQHPTSTKTAVHPTSSSKTISDQVLCEWRKELTPRVHAALLNWTTESGQPLSYQNIIDTPLPALAQTFYKA